MVSGSGMYSYCSGRVPEIHSGLSLSGKAGPAPGPPSATPAAGPPSWPCAGDPPRPPPGRPPGSEREHKGFPVPGIWSIFSSGPRKPTSPLHYRSPGGTDLAEPWGPIGPLSGGIPLPPVSRKKLKLFLACNSRRQQKAVIRSGDLRFRLNHPSYSPRRPEVEISPLHQNLPALLADAEAGLVNPPPVGDQAAGQTGRYLPPAHTAPQATHLFHLPPSPYLAVPTAPPENDRPGPSSI